MKSALPMHAEYVASEGDDKNSRMAKCERRMGFCVLIESISGIRGSDDPSYVVAKLSVNINLAPLLR